MLLIRLLEDVNYAVNTYGTMALALGTLAIPGIRSLGSGRRNCLNGAIFVAYLYIFLQITLFSRTPTGIHVFDTSLFGDIGYLSKYLVVHFAENFLLFIPLGMLVALCFNKMRNIFAGLLFGFVLSFCLECVQFITTLGMFELHDILMNGLGYAAGYIFWRLLYWRTIQYEIKTSTYSI